MSPDRRHLPSPDRPVPTATYRLQLRAEFGFDDAASVVDLLDALGVSHVYLSPVLQAAPESTHGYDVVDHSRLSDELGGSAAFERLAEALRRRGMGAVVDVVPNHMAVPVPATLNKALWSVLREGPQSPYASWFDVDWAAHDRALLMPVLGQRIGDALAAGEIALDTTGSEPVVRYYEHVLPVRPGTETLPLPELLDRQFYRLAYWRVADEELNYRRFFDIDTLAGLRVENPDVFAEAHRLLISLVRAGRLDGLRVDHPDGLADPRGYLRRLADATSGSWVVVEKILEGEERLPADWPCAGTSGYDALFYVGGVFVDPAGEQPVTDLYAAISGEPAEFPPVLEEAKRVVVTDALRAEVNRLTDLLAAICHDDIGLRDHTRRGLEQALVELLVAFRVYRAYVVPGEEPPAASVAEVERAAQRAREQAPQVADEIDLVRDLALGRCGRDRHRDEFCVRFQQSTGPVMAKGVEDTAFYRWFRLAALNEVGGDPGHFGVPVAEFHDFCVRIQRDWPLTMTTLTTHDTKRAEDVRARLSVLSQLPEEWGSAVTAWRAAASSYGCPDANTEYLFWQTLVGSWPIDEQRLVGYLEKATREAKRHTSWVRPDEEYDAAVRGFAKRVLSDASLTADVARFVDRIEPHARVAVLGQKLLQLAMPGIPDVYQGCELVNLSLVDPDNRRPVDYAVRRRALAALGAGAAADTLDQQKLLVTSRALRLRREHPEWFGASATYEPLPAGGSAAAHVLAFGRSARVVAVVPRLTVALERSGGWRDTTLPLPDGRWMDVLTGVEHTSGARPVAALLGGFPVALLRRD